MKSIFSNDFAQRRNCDNGRDYELFPIDSLDYCIPTNNDNSNIDTKKIIACTFSMESISEFTQDYLNPLQNPHWDYMTHLIFQCLIIDNNGAVKVNDGSSNSDIRRSHQTYIPFINSLRRCFPHLKIVFSFVLDFTNSALIDRCIGIQHKEFFRSLINCVDAYKADGVALNLTCVKNIPDTLINDLERIKRINDIELFITLNNKTDWTNTENIDVLKDIATVADMIIFNSYGFMNEIWGGTAYSPEPECSISQFKTLISSIEDNISICNVLMGVDTSGVSYNLNSVGKATTFDLISLQKIERLKILGDYEFSNNVNYIENDYGDEGSILEKEVRYCGKKISYDNYQARIKKLKYVSDVNMGGCILGELRRDLYVTNKESILNISYTLLKPFGLSLFKNKLCL